MSAYNFASCPLSRRNAIMTPLLSTIASLPIFLGTRGANSQTTHDRADRIKSALNRLESPDPIDRQVAVDECLDDKDPLLRSKCLEKALSIKDSRIRQIAFSYFIKIQNELVIYADVDERINAIGDNQLRYYLTNMSILHMKISEFDKMTKQFSGDLGMFGRCEGQVTQDGVLITFGVGGHSHTWKIQLKSVSDGYLIGSLGNGQLTFAAKSALP